MHHHATAIEDRYRILDLLGSGAMGRIDLAEDLQLGRQVAVKRILPARADAFSRERFMQEARVTARLAHPNVVRLLDFGVTDVGELFIVYEYVAGRSLEETRLAATPHLESPWVARLGAVLADALDAAHAMGVLHRDVKPPNILVRPDDAPVLCDFGLAKDLGPDGLDTATGRVLGTPTFLDPAMLRGGAPSARSDQYSLAATLFTCRAGHNPYDRDALLAMLGGRPARPVQLPEFPDAIDRALFQVLAPALRPEPEARYATMASFRDQLLEVAEGRPRRPRPAAQAAPSLDPRPPPPLRAPVARRRLVAGVAAGLGIPLLLIAGALRGPPADPGPAPRAAPLARGTPEPAPLAAALESARRAAGRLAAWTDGAAPDTRPMPFRNHRDRARSDRSLSRTLADGQLDLELEEYAEALITWVHDHLRAGSPLPAGALRDLVLGPPLRTLKRLREFETAGVQSGITASLDPDVLAYAAATRGRWARAAAALGRVCDQLEGQPTRSLEAAMAQAVLSALARHPSFLPVRERLLEHLEATPSLGPPEAEAFEAMASGLGTPLYAGAGTCERRRLLLRRARELLEARSCLEDPAPACRVAASAWLVERFRLAILCDEGASPERAAAVARLDQGTTRWPAQDRRELRDELRWFVELAPQVSFQGRDDLRALLGGAG